MVELKELCRDRWGTIITNSDNRHIEILWTGLTSDMTDEDFMVWLESFAGFVESGS